VVDDADEARRADSRAAAKARGLMLGLALGESLGGARGALPATGPIRAGVSTQLACFTVEGLIRAYVRGAHKGICHPPSVVWHAYCRWAAVQGIEVEKMRGRWASGAGKLWPDGWLAQVPALAERRGSAPATVAALSKVEQGTTEKPATNSRGCHALTRTLPVALLGLRSGRDNWIGQAREIAALTHGDPLAQSAAVGAAVLVRHCLSSVRRFDSASFYGKPAPDPAQVRDALRAGLDALASKPRSGLGSEPGTELGTEETRALDAAFRLALDRPADAGELARLAPDATATSALLGGLYVAASLPDRAELDAALRFAASAPAGDSVACVAGALLGAAHGVDALSPALLSRHELGWTLDRLAGDFLSQLIDSPSGTEYTVGWDPSWWQRYPGW
jgi:hypothetical protein